MTATESINKDQQEAFALFARGDFAGAEKIFRSARDAAPDDTKAQYNLGVTLAKLERYEDAATCFRKAIELDPSFAPAYTNLGFCLSAFNDIAGARTVFAQARRLTPDNPIPVVNEGIAALALGDYTVGWHDFAARWRLPAYAKFRQDFSKPCWNGEDLSGKTLFLYAEQGFGDTIQMARFAPLLAARGAKIIIESQPALAPLLRSLSSTPQIIAKGDAVPDFDFYSAMMDLPRALGTTIETIPATTPYLFADASQVNAYQKLLTRSSARRVGLCWAGRSSHENDHNRSLRFAQLTPLLASADIEWVSLQRLVPPHDRAALTASSVLDWGQTFADFSSAAAAIAALDLVITVDTAIAHLAGALGKQVWILLPFYADWRWLIDRKDSPWYSTARLFRQKKRGAWSDVIATVQASL